MKETERPRRARARAEAVVSGEGGSPKMKNLMKHPIKMTTESWPRRKPCVNERLSVSTYQQIVACMVVCSELTRTAVLGPAEEKHLEQC